MRTSQEWVSFIELGDGEVGNPSTQVVQDPEGQTLVLRLDPVHVPSLVPRGPVK